MPRLPSPRVLLVAMLALSGLAIPRLRAECPVYDVDDVVTADRRGAVDMPALPLQVHEWGVWRLSSSGHVASLEELVRESPSFVHRSAEATNVTIAPASPPEYEICDKPVIFLHAPQTMRVELTVGFPSGRPWLTYPAAVDGMLNGTRSLRWTGTAYASAAEVPALVRAPVGAQHWWSFLRAAGASPFTSDQAAESEDFLFYDGQTSFPQGFRTRRRSATPIAGAMDEIAWQLERGRASHLVIHGTNVTRTALASIDALRADMRATFLAKGLTAGEADSLLDTWRSNLFAGNTRRVIWMLPRATYDAMLPLQVSPPPTEIVRVGVVIQTYGR